MKFTTNIFKTIGLKIKKIFWIFALHAFWLILLFILIDLLFGSFIFYKYVFLAESEEGTITEKITKFNEKAYQNILKELQSRDLLDLK